MFPYKYRKYQKELVDFVLDGLNRKKHIVFESSAGSGKTICVVYTISEYLKLCNDTKKVIYTTRTNSQQKQVLHELRNIKDRKFIACGLQGRANLCEYVSILPDLKKGSPEELSFFCKQQKNKGCKYFENIEESKSIEEIENLVMNHIPEVEELKIYCKKRELCAYETIKKLLLSAKLIVVPYVYFFSPVLRKKLLEMCKSKIEDIIVVVDEAHNLPEYGRELNSCWLSTTTLKISKDEAINILDNPKVINNLKLTEFYQMFNKIFNEVKDKYAPHDYESTDDVHGTLIPQDLIENIFLNTYNLSLDMLKDAASEMIFFGEEVKQYKTKHGKLPRSYIEHVGDFLFSWIESDDKWAKLVTSEPKLELYCLDPSIMTKIVNECSSSIHFSGTLEPIKEYCDSIGIEDAITRIFPSPFPEENRIMLSLPGVTTKFSVMTTDMDMLRKLKSYVKIITSVFSKNMIIFFPSFSLMEKFIDVPPKNKKLYIEKRDVSQEDLMKIINEFKNHRNCILYSVFGGRISEGIDFPDETLELVVLVGLPYPKPTAKHDALIKYYDVKFDGKGWDYVVKTPTIRKVKQSIGRLIRNETDRGAAIILDKRITQFRDYISVYETKNFIEILRAFYR